MQPRQSNGLVALNAEALQRDWWLWSRSRHVLLACKDTVFRMASRIAAPGQGRHIKA